MPKKRCRAESIEEPMKRFQLLLLLICVSAMPLLAADQWQPAKAPLMTRWAKDVSPENALPEYPRPQLERAQWLNLNGLWNFAVTRRGDTAAENFTQKILVPFPAESALSGVMTNIT